MADIIPLDQVAPRWIEDLLDRAFGRDRLARTAYKVREGMEQLEALSFAAIENEALVGSIQCWPVMVSAPDGKSHPMIMVGPVAVLPERQQSGIGKALMLAMLAALVDGEALPLVMIGDADYYGRFFGFSADRTGGWRLPGPFEQHRLLVRADAARPLPAEGFLGPWRR